jgi:nitrogen regulatory protein P-II 1
MKRVEAIVRPTKVGDVCSALDKAGHAGIMISEIEGHGTQKGLEQQLRGKTYKVDFLTKARIELVVKDSDVDTFIKVICDSAFTGKVGDGKIFVHPIENSVRIRTREQGDVAL